MRDGCLHDHRRRHRFVSLEILPFDPRDLDHRGDFVCSDAGWRRRHEDGRCAQTRELGRRPITRSKPGIGTSVAASAQGAVCIEDLVERGTAYADQSAAWREHVEYRRQRFEGGLNKSVLLTAPRDSGFIGADRHLRGAMSHKSACIRSSCFRLGGAGDCA